MCVGKITGCDHLPLEVRCDTRSEKGICGSRWNGASCYRNRSICTIKIKSARPCLTNGPEGVRGGVRNRSPGVETSRICDEGVEQVRGASGVVGTIKPERLQCSHRRCRRPRGGSDPSPAPHPAKQQRDTNTSSKPKSFLQLHLSVSSVPLLAGAASIRFG